MRTDDIISQHLNTFRSDVRARMDAEHKNATRRAYNSFEVVRLGAGHWGMEGWRYSGVMERGREAHKNLPKEIIANLQMWARAKGLTLTERMVKSIAHRIFELGMHPDYFVEDLFTRPWESLTNELPLALGDEFIAQLKNQVFNVD